MYKYIHIPFCNKKCYYCDFTTFEGNHNHKKYFDYLNIENKLYPKYELETIYFGGGTPSSVDSKYIDEIVSNEILKDDCEITVEVNPESYKKYEKVNRLSIGIQTFNDDMLKKIGRLHDSKKAIDTYMKAKSNVGNVSIDLMFALPDQTLEMLKYDLGMIKKLMPTHISIYSLIWKEGTPFHGLLNRGTLKKISEDSEADFYEYIIDFLEDLGYLHYEVSSFCLDNRVSKHNLAYWRNYEYIGLGLGASGYLYGKRYKNHVSFEKYYSALSKGERAIQNIENCKEEKKEELDIILGLRMLKEGIPLNQKDMYIQKLDKYVDLGLIEKSDRYRLTRRGLLLSNEIFSDIIS